MIYSSFLLFFKLYNILFKSAYYSIDDGKGANSVMVGTLNYVDVKLRENNYVLRYYMTNYINYIMIYRLHAYLQCKLKRE